MDADALQAAYDAFVTARGKFEDHSNAVARGDSSDFEQLVLLLGELNAAQHRFSTLAEKVTLEMRH